MGKRVALLVLVLLVIIGGAILWTRSRKESVPPVPAPAVPDTPAVTSPPEPTPAATEAPAPTAVCPCTDANGDIEVTAKMGDLPTTCVYADKGTKLTWRSTDNSRLQRGIPDWGTQAPTTPINPYPAAVCPANPGNFCVSGAFAGQAIPNCTEIRYSITTIVGTTPKQHFGRIIIVKP